MTYRESSPTGIFIKATINLKRYIDNNEDDTLSFIITNIPQVSVPPLGGEGDFKAGYPILLEVGELGEEHDELMPRPTTSSLVLSNKKDSLGFQRRFSDLLEYYTIVEQDVTIDFYVSNFPLYTSSLDSGDVISTWKLKTSSVSVDLERETVTIDLKNSSLTDKVITKQVTLTDFPNAPQSSIGKYLPIAIGAGEVPVVATRISDTEHALTTTIGTTYPINSVTQYYAKHPDGTFRVIEGTASTITNLVIGGLSTLNATRTLGEGIAFPLRIDDDYLLHSMTVQFTGTSTVSATGNITLQVVESKIPINASKLGYFKNESDYTVLGSAVIDKANWVASISGTGNFSPTFTFDYPVVLSPSSRTKITYTNFTYFYVIIKDSNPAKPVSMKMYNNPSGNTAGSELTYSNGIWTETTLYNQAIHQAYGVTLTLSTGSSADNNGLGYSKVTVGTLSTCDATSLQLAAVIAGLSSGGLARGYLYEILPFFFSSDEFDTTDVFGTFTQTLVGAKYSRLLSGSTNGRTTRLQLTRELLRNSGARLISLASSGSSKVGLYYWGGLASRSGVVDDRFCKTTSYGVGSRASVINNITASYKKNVIITNAQDLIEQGASSGYSAVIENERLSGSSSITLYGSNDLSNATFPYIRDEDSMESVANYYLRSFEHPYKFVEFYIPYAEGFGFPDYNELPTNVLCTQVIESMTAQMPAFYGTSPRPLKPVSEDNEIVVETSGFDYIRAKRYRLQVESKRIRFVDNIPVLYFTCKILDNENDPT